MLTKEEYKRLLQEENKIQQELQETKKDLIIYSRILERIQKLKQTVIVPEKTRPNYGAWKWTDAMSGDGPVVPDALHWRQKFDDAVLEIRNLQNTMSELASENSKLKLTISALTEERE